MEQKIKTTQSTQTVEQISELPKEFKKVTYNNNRGDKVTTTKEVIENCTPEQLEFRELVNKNKSRLFAEDVPLTHRGVEIKFGGCGPKAFRYLIAIANMSDKDEIEEVPMYLDWDDTALEDIVPQIEAILGIKKSQTKIAPIIVGGK